MNHSTSTHQVALYARVSSDKQKEEGTIDSQIEALLVEASDRHWQIPEEWIFRDEGYSGANLERPGLESLRDLVYVTGSVCFFFISDSRRRRHAVTD